MAVKTDLRIALYAGEVLVAESDDPKLWQQVLGRITVPTDAGAEIEGDAGSLDSGLGDGKDAVDKFAAKLGLSRDQVVGACSPSTTPPYIHLDEHHWEDLKKNTPSRGPGSISPTVLALTLLVLWKGAAGLDLPVASEGDAVRETIGLDDRNKSRALKNCEWLQKRDGHVRLNPSQTSSAIAIASAYCARTPAA